MTEYYKDENITIYNNDCLEVLKQIPDNSIDAIITDPPYALGFMGKAWDKFPSDIGAKNHLLIKVRKVN